MSTLGSLLAAALSGLALLGAAAAAQTAASGSGDRDRDVSHPAGAVQPDSRLAWWHEAHFGMFIHFGPYARLGGQWKGRSVGGDSVFIFRSAKIPIAEYERMADQFDPQHFDADAIAELAADAGMKYIVFTAKHLDGFAMYHSRASAFNLYDATACRRDLVAELAAACRRHGLRFGLYYSQARDWYHPGGVIDAKGSPHWDPAGRGDFDQYLRTVAVPQVRELLTHYGPIDVFWFDTPNQMTAERTALFKPLLALQPRMLTDNRLGIGAPGDFDTPEQYIPNLAETGRAWESCMTINHNWGYCSDDNDWKSAKTLLYNLTSVVGKGGNYLLDIGPKGDGSVPEPIVDRLHALGRWMKANNTSIYGAQAAPFRYLPWGSASTKPGRLYLDVFDWPADGRLLVPMSTPVLRAYALAAPGRPLRTATTPDGVEIDLSSVSADPLATVIVAEIGSEAQPIRQGIRPDGFGDFALKADHAEIHGVYLRLKNEEITDWRDGYNVTWPIYVELPKTYRVEVSYRSPATSPNAEFSLTIGGHPTPFRPEASSPGATAVVAAGDVRLDGNSTYDVSLALKGIAREFSLRGIRLEPLDGPTPPAP